MGHVPDHKSARKLPIRRRRQGKFTGRLVSEEGINNALRRLLLGAQRYMFIINRSTVNADTGESQDASISLSETDPPSLEGSLDPRVKHSRHVIIVIIESDGGAAKIDLTRRNWEIWITSATIRDKLYAFNQDLRSDAHSRLVTATAAFWIFSLPGWSWFLLFLGWSFFSPQGRYEVWSTSRPEDASVASPAWLVHFTQTMGKLWPIFILASLVIASIILLSGGLRIWPKFLSRPSFQRAAYEIRSNFMLPENINSPLFASLVGAVGGAIVTYLLVRYLG